MGASRADAHVLSRPLGRPDCSPDKRRRTLQALLTLYDLRLDADYRAESVIREKAQEAEQTVTELFDLIVRHIIIEQQNP
jgi:hypothetical protein